MAEKFEFRLNSKHRKRLLEDVEDEFRDLHDKDSRTADVELALEKALEWSELRKEKREELRELQEESRELRDDWDL